MSLYDMTDAAGLLGEGPPAPETPFTPAALARIKGCNERTVRRAITRGDLRAYDAAHSPARPAWVVLWRDAADWQPRAEGRPAIHSPPHQG